MSMTSTDPGRRSRRQLLAAAVALSSSALFARRARAFGEEGAFNPRILLTGTRKWTGPRTTSPQRWAQEVIRRTSAPARKKPTLVRADAAELLAEPFAIWSGKKAPEPLTRAELRGLRHFIALGGVLLVDEQEPNAGAFLKEAKRQLARVLPRGSAIDLGPENVVFRSFYLLQKATGRIERAPKLKGIVRGGALQVIFSPNDLLGALAQQAGGVKPFQLKPGGAQQRERAERQAVNIAMYVLCSNYKDDQVHAPFLMRRRATGKP